MSSVERQHKESKESKAAVPIAWPRARLGDICEIVRGVSYKKDQASELPAKGLVPILRATNIQDSTLVLDADLVYVPTNVVSDQQILQVGDIIVATSSGSKHLVGKTAQVKKPWRGSFGAFCAALRPKTVIDHRYLGYFFGSQEYKDYIRKKALGVNINNLRRGDLEEISIPVAPLVQQKHIVEEIEKQFSRLDEAIANLKRVKANLKRYKAAVLKAAVEGRLVEANVEGNMCGWRVARIGEITEINPQCNKAAIDDDLYVSFVPMPAVGADDGTIKVDEQRFAREVKKGFTSFAEGDVLFAKITPCMENGKMVVVPKLINGYGFGSTEFHVLRPKHDIDAKFLYYSVSNQSFRGEAERYMTGAVGQRRVPTDYLRKCQISVPPLTEQHRIVTEVDRRLSLIREIEAQVEANFKRADRLRQSILQREFSGGLVIGAVPN